MIGEQQFNSIGHAQFEIVYYVEKEQEKNMRRLVIFI